MSEAAHAPEHWPESALVSLDTLWLQVAGTLCNLQCTHCFISCSPFNHAHGMMTLAAVRGHLDEARALGVREYYFTGGEPFLNRELMAMIAATLAQGPLTILTNGVLISDDTAAELKRLADGSDYSLDVRVSLDGFDAESNDAVRGAGTFARILAALGRLARAGLSPIVTVTEACDGAATSAGRARLLRFLAEAGLARPRLKVMPLLRLGAETARTRAYQPWETLRDRALSAEEAGALQCATARMATSRGVYVCPILIDAPAARMGATLRESLRPFALRHQACYTCHEQGLTCRT